MRLIDFIASLETARTLYKKKHKDKEPAIFDLQWNDDDDKECISAELCGEVIYEDDSFTRGSKTGKKPLYFALIKPECLDGSVDDWSVELESDE